MGAVCGSLPRPCGARCNPLVGEGRLGRGVVASAVRAEFAFLGFGGAAVSLGPHGSACMHLEARLAPLDLPPRHTCDVSAPCCAGPPSRSTLRARKRQAPRPRASRTHPHNSARWRAAPRPAPPLPPPPPRRAPATPRAAAAAPARARCGRRRRRARPPPRRSPLRLPPRGRRPRPPRPLPPRPWLWRRPPRPAAGGAVFWGGKRGRRVCNSAQRDELLARALPSRTHTRAPGVKPQAAVACCECRARGAARRVCVDCRRGGAPFCGPPGSRPARPSRPATPPAPRRPPRP